MHGIIGGIGGIRIQLNKLHPKHSTKKYSVTFKGHSFVRWLAKFLPFNPDITVEYQQDADPFYFNNTLYCGWNAYRQIKEQTGE